MEQQKINETLLRNVTLLSRQSESEEGMMPMGST